MRKDGSSETQNCPNRKVRPKQNRRWWRSAIRGAWSLRDSIQQRRSHDHSQPARWVGRLVRLLQPLDHSIHHLCGPVDLPFPFVHSDSAPRTFSNRPMRPCASGWALLIVFVPQSPPKITVKLNPPLKIPPYPFRNLVTRCPR